MVRELLVTGRIRTGRIRSGDMWYQFWEWVSVGRV